MSRPISGRGSGGAGITVDPAASEMLRDLLLRASPVVFGAVDAEMQKLTQTAKSLWPVKTGRSRDSIAYVVRVSGQRIVASLVVSAEYARYVWSKKLHKNAAQALVLNPADGLAERLEPVIREEMAK